MKYSFQAERNGKAMEKLKDGAQKWFTDGSKSGYKVGAGMIGPSHNSLRRINDISN